jgi:hypothetical protein
MRLFEITLSPEPAITADRTGRSRETMRISVFLSPDGTPETAVGLYRDWETALPGDIQKVVADIAFPSGQFPTEDFWHSQGFSHAYAGVTDQHPGFMKRLMVKGVNGHTTPKPVRAAPVDPEAEQRRLDAAAAAREEIARKDALRTASPRWRLLFTLSDWDELPAYSANAIQDGRKARLEDALLEVENETLPYRNVRGMLYRGLSLTPEQRDDLIRTGSLAVPQTRIGSWSTEMRTAVSFGEEMPGLGIVIAVPAARLDVVVDFVAVGRSRTPEERKFTYMNYAIREKEVLVRNPEPRLVITRDMVVWDNFKD